MAPATQAAVALKGPSVLFPAGDWLPPPKGEGWAGSRLPLSVPPPSGGGGMATLPYITIDKSPLQAYSNEAYQAPVILDEERNRYG